VLTQCINIICIDHYLMCFVCVPFTLNCIDCLIVGDFKLKFVKNVFVLVLWERQGGEVGTINLWKLGS